MISKQNMKLGVDFFVVHKTFDENRPVLVRLVGIQNQVYIENLVTQEKITKTKYLLTPVESIDTSRSEHYKKSYVLSEDFLEQIFWTKEGAEKYLQK